MYKQLNKCPVCGEELTVMRLYCSHCDTTVEGHFTPDMGPFAQLNPEQTQFVVQFVRCEGRFNRLEEELNLSYPTLRNRLNEIVRAMGYEPGKEEPPVRLTVEERRQILEDLDNGAITPAEAQRQLRGK